MINQLLVKCELVTTEEYKKTFTSITADSYLLKRESENKESVFDCSQFIDMHPAMMDHKKILIHITGSQAKRVGNNWISTLKGNESILTE